MLARLELVLGGATLPVLALMLLLAAGSWIYWPGISGPSLLDDRSSVLTIGDLQESPERALDYVFGDKSGALGRSVSMATFVLEKLYLNEGIEGNKRTNIILHIVNGLLVVWLFWLLFRFLDMSGYRWLAVVLGGIWLLHPFFVSTVLYVVQRMAMLSTFFMLLTCISYVSWRLSMLSGRAAHWKLLLMLLFFALGMLSKENTIVIVPTLLLLEVMWFECRGPDDSVIGWLKKTCYTLIVAGSTVMSAVLFLRYEQLAERFSRRPFTLDERLLTQSRVVWDYLGQLVNPQLQRMGLYHDDVLVSQSLQMPQTTQYAVIGWGLLLTLCLVMLKWRYGRLMVFGVAWFLLGHSVESTVLPLEMYFEHRNYAPSIGILIVLGAACAAVITRWRSLQGPILVYLCVGLLLLSAQTSSQVLVWSSRPLLMLHHLNGHPQSSRANTDMAVQMALHGELDAALQYSHAAYLASQNKSSGMERLADREIRNLALSCTAKKPPPEGMLDNWGSEDPNRPLSSVATLLTMVRLLQDEKCPHIDRVAFADSMASVYLADEKKRGAAKIYASLAILENALARYDKALAYAERVLQVSPQNRKALLMKLHFVTALGQLDAKQAVVEQLQALEAQGKLTVGEQQTLALYLEK